MSPAPGRAGLARALRSLRMALVWVCFVGGFGLAAREAWILWTLTGENRIVAALKAGRDIPVSVDRSDALVYARLDFLLYRDRIEEAEPYVERIARSRNDRLAAEGLMAGGNARMRRAIEFLELGKVDDAVPYVGVAKQRYIQGLKRDPTNWSLKYDLDVAMRLVRDFPELEVTGDDETPAIPKKLWTELPGLPKGLP